MATRFKKQAAEVLPLAFEFSGKLPSSTSLSSATMQATRLSDGVVDNTVLSSTTGTVNGTQVRYTVTGGTHGERYLIQCRATLNTGTILDEEVLMIVEDV